MQTLQDRLTVFCTQNDKPIPFGKYLAAISHTVIKRVKDAELYDKVKKRNEPLQVNCYPAASYRIIDDVIKEFFDHRNQFVKAATKISVTAPKARYFNYDTDDFKAVDLEAAAKLVGVEVSRNWENKGVVQFKVPLTDPVKLIRLGKVFVHVRMKRIANERCRKPFKKVPRETN